MTDFEKLLFAEGYIKELKDALRKAEFNNGVLRSEIDDIMHYLKTNQPRSNSLMRYRKYINNINKQQEKLKDELYKYKFDNLKLNKELSYYKLKK
jgi:hypothetical protein